MNIRIARVIKINLLLLLLLIIYYIVNKYTNFYIPCIFRIMTGFKCPGCGITHSIFSIIKLDFKSAFEYNPLVFIYLPFIVCYYIYINYLYIFNKKDVILKRIPKFVGILVIIITIAYGVLRNIY